jgi:superfamily II DNA or RNA helicase
LTRTASPAVQSQTLSATDLCEVVLTPAGQLLLNEAACRLNGVAEPLSKRLAGAFCAGTARGLFTLAAARWDAALPAALSFWREFSCLYLSELCRHPESSEPGLQDTAEPDRPQLESFLAGAPPMPGAEYLNIDMLLDLWHELDAFVQREVSSSGETLSTWLKEQAPLWHQVGRVCFHLAENKRDPEFPFAFLATYAPGISSGGKVQYQPLSAAIKEYAGEHNKSGLVKLLTPVQLASEKSALVKELVESSDIFHPIVWSPQEAYRFLKDAPLLEESGVLVRLPDWWRKSPRPRVAVTIGEQKQSRLGLDVMLDFQVELVLGDLKLTKSELQQIMSAQEGLVYIKGQWVEIDRERLSEALSHWQALDKKAARGGISFIEGMRLLAGAPTDLNPQKAADLETREWSFVNAGSWLAGVLAGLREPGKLASRALSREFNGTLRSYQITGHNWLWFLSRLGLGACLADDMGLGKTVQILALLLTLKEETRSAANPSLLVLPASLLANWKAEIKRFAPGLSACFFHSSEMTASELADMAGNAEHAFSRFDLVLTTYGMLLRQSCLADRQWQLVILDEAQAIKNPATRQSRAVKQLKSISRIALTGTPVENRLGDLWSLFDFLSPGLLGSAAKFKQFVKQLDEREHHRFAPLRNLVAPYILRRLKTDKTIIADLPDKTEVKVFCGLTKEQLALYARSVEELSRTLEEVDGMKRRGLVLAFLLKFKQICNHPSQFLGDGAYDFARSGKFERLRSIAEEIASRQEKVLVFSQFREMTGPLCAFLAESFGRPGLLLHGGTAIGARQDIVDSFQRPEGPPFLVLSLKAGGTGLNLTAASHVVHFDRWWNPAVENQATDRAYRIGQHRNVLVHKFICQGTIEEKIDALIAEKSDLADDILGGGAETMLTEMSDADLLKIVALDLDRVSLD